MVSIGSQFSTGDQASRESFWRSGFKICNSCQKQCIKEEDHVAGCRHNGDGYGTTVFTCTACGWKTSFQYDEASDLYYYETRNFDRVPKKVEPQPWSNLNVSNWLRSSGISVTALKKLQEYAITGPDMYDMTDKKLKALGFEKLDRYMIMHAQNKRMENTEEE